MIVDLFSGPRGWDEGLRKLGRTSVGIETDASACATSIAAGHPVIRADVATYPIPRGRVEGLIGSPPCPTFSTAGKGGGRAELPRLHRLAQGFLNGPQPIPSDGWADPRTPLVLEPLRWATELVPDWIALEQVPPVLDLWHTFAEVLAALGWSTWCGVLEAERYGVPQTRDRAILIAHRRRAVHPPTPTHQRYVKGVPARREVGLFGTLEPWVSMADALGWGDFDAHYQRGAGLTERHGERPDRPCEAPAPTLTGSALGAGAGAKLSLVLREAQAHGTVRTLDEPAMTITGSADNGNFAWTLHTNRGQREDGSRQTRATTEPAPSLTGKAGGQWAFDRPATTIAGDPRCWPPGHKINADDARRLGAEEAEERYGDRRGSEAIRLTVRDALILQSFPRDYPVQGTRSKQFEQVGNAVPPRLAAAILGQLIR